MAKVEITKEGEALAVAGAVNYNSIAFNLEQTGEKGYYIQLEFKADDVVVGTLSYDGYVRIGDTFNVTGLFGQLAVS